LKLKPRVIPTLLLKGKGLVKGIQFKNHTYIGDPINAVKLFNDLEVDELIFLDITASIEKRTISSVIIEQLADECFMPFTVGGGINKVSQIEELLYAGAEKVSINTSALSNVDFIKEASNNFGSQCIVVSIDVKKNIFGGYNIYSYSGTIKEKISLLDYVKIIQDKGAGEILINSINNEGTQTGLDLLLIKSITDISNIPVIATGGAGNINHLTEAFKQSKASAVAAGSMFVFHGKKRGVLINFISEQERKRIAE